MYVSNVAVFLDIYHIMIIMAIIRIPFICNPYVDVWSRFNVSLTRLREDHLAGRGVDQVVTIIFCISLFVGLN